MTYASASEPGADTPVVLWHQLSERLRDESHVSDRAKAVNVLQGVRRRSKRMSLRGRSRTGTVREQR